jgi:hypothetical protein
MAGYRKRAKAAFLESEAAAVVIGLRNCKTASRRSRSSSSNLNHNDQGSVSSHNTGMNRARMVKLLIRQKVPEPSLSHLIHTCRWRAKSPAGGKLPGSIF